MRSQVKEMTLAQLGVNPADINKQAASIVRKLQENKFESYIVGGAVRDLVLGMHPKDFDVATAARPEQVKKIFGRRARIIGRRFRIVHVRSGSELIEVATFRARPKKSGASANGQIVDDNTYGSSRDDAFRRDMTANALLLNPAKNRIIDYVNGVADLKRRQLRMIGEPELRYTEDPVRMLRTIRLAAKLELNIEAGTAKPIAANAALLASIPRARLVDETIKILYSGASRQSIDLLEHFKLTDQLFPHLSRLAKEDLDFVRLALGINDANHRKEGKASVTVAAAALFWPLVRKQYASMNRPTQEDFFDLLDQTKMHQSELLTRRIVQNAYDLLYTMHRMNVMHKSRRAERMLERDRLRPVLNKALVFEQARVEAGEASHEVFSWWSDMLVANKEERAKAFEALPSLRRRRPRKNAAAIS